MDVSLDQHLNPIDSPIAQQSSDGTVVTSYDFASLYDRNAIDLTKIKNFSFSSGTGGTLTLGGTANGNGLLQLKNAAGSVIVRGDQNGIAVYNGSISIQNASGSVALDASGLVSLPSFTNAEVTGNSTQTTTSTSFVDVPGSSMSDLVLSRSAKVFFYLLIYGENPDFYRYGANYEVHIYDSFLTASTGINVFVTGKAIDYVQWSPTGVLDSLGNPITIGAVTQSDVYRAAETQSNMGALTVAAGTHTYKLRFKAYDNFGKGAGTAIIYNFRYGYVILGT